MCVYLSIDLKRITDDRLRTHIQNAGPVDFLMLYLSTSLSAAWTRVMLPSELQSRRKGSDCNQHASALLAQPWRSRWRLRRDILTSAAFCSRKLTQAKLSSRCSSPQWHTRILSVALSLSHTHTHSLSHTHTRTCTHRHTHTHVIKPYLWFSELI